MPELSDTGLRQIDSAPNRFPDVVAQRAAVWRRTDHGTGFTRQAAERDIPARNRSLTGGLIDRLLLNDGEGDVAYLVGRCGRARVEPGVVDLSGRANACPAVFAGSSRRERRRPTGFVAIPTVPW